MKEPLIHRIGPPEDARPPEEKGPGKGDGATDERGPPDRQQPQPDNAAPQRPMRFPIVALWVAACLVTQVALAGSLAWDRYALLTEVWRGTMWGGWAGCVWICSAWSGRRWFWALMLATAAIWHVYWMSQTARLAPERYVVMLGAYGVAQGILFRLLRVARWRESPLSIAEAPQWRSQFGIADLIGLTTAVALLITAASRYQPPLGNLYWRGLAVAEALLVGIAALAVMAALGRGRPQRRWLRIAVVGAIVAAAGILDALEKIAAAGSPQERVWLRYAILLLTFWAWISTLATAGRTASGAQADETALPPEC